MINWLEQAADDALTALRRLQSIAANLDKAATQGEISQEEILTATALAQSAWTIAETAREIEQGIAALRGAERQRRGTASQLEVSHAST